ncbi:MAG: DUF1326 domain-containing protein [Candidatus Dormibacteraeota bacterium]|uniref:DUF1326 domain-containing protein n=1 Tax=Candidatus Dormiibacter inghamiae TaxID=3127013 RepID=A0A934KGB2_9BACT|nr:DUF1326 domain-containing protein [Candidatus Dormibacteraeota bacterium]
MSFHVSGDYFESCNCQVSCPCIFLAPATEDTCDAVLAWHIRRGDMDGVSLENLTVALAVHSPKLMREGGWKAALYLDERADADQAKALGAIFSGQAGGHLANVAPLIGTVTGVHSASIRFDSDGGRRRLSVGKVLEMDVEELKGMDGVGPPVISNPLFSPVTQPIRQAKSGTLDYKGDWTVSATSSNGFITEFEYRS